MRLIFSMVLALLIGASSYDSDDVLVKADLAEPLDEHTGADIQAALDGPCAEARGCTLRLEANTSYDDVAITLGRETKTKFAKGLRIQGSGGSRVRAPVPQIQPVFLLNGAREQIGFRGFEIDGRKREQPPTVELHESKGIAVRSPGGGYTNRGVVEEMSIRDFLHAGVFIRQGEGWTIARNKIYDIGCHRIVTPCDAWDKGHEDDRFVVGRTSVGFGVQLVVDSRDATVVENEIERATKMGIEVYTSGALNRPADKIAHGHSILRNVVKQSIGVGIGINGGHTIRVIGNRATLGGGPGITGNMGAGFSAAQRSWGLTFSNNHSISNGGDGFRIGAWGDDILVQDNVAKANCTQKLLPGMEYAIGTGADTPDGFWPSGLTVSGNIAEGGDCEYGIYLEGHQQFKVNSNLVSRVDPTRARGVLLFVQNSRNGEIGLNKLSDARVGIRLKEDIDLGRVNLHGNAIENTELPLVHEGH